MRIEIVTHCYRYASLLRYQLSSFELYPLEGVKVTATVFYTSSDCPTSSVLEWFGNRSVQGVTWNWRELPVRELCKRSLGRNRAALESEADWVWFCDADHWFTGECWKAFKKVNVMGAPLIFPAIVNKHRTHGLGDECISHALRTPGLLAADPVEFEPTKMGRAIGGIQIVSGDFCRSQGYLRDSKQAQQPMAEAIWVSTREDWWFRKQLGTPGVPVNLPGVYRIRHSKAGRSSPGLTL